MLINDFFEIIKTSKIGDKLISNIKLNAKHKIYSGHFPNNPITPGVVQMQIVKEILEYTYKKDLKLIAMPRCKFLKILDPIQTPFITITISSAESPFQVSAEGLQGEDVYFKLSATFSDEPRSN
jgi:3-hydroxyacyl-[acyl-carrier-protein] dehydratase